MTMRLSSSLAGCLWGLAVLGSEAGPRVGPTKDSADSSAGECSVCKRLACENCPRMQPCLPRGLLRYVHAGEENLPPVLRVLCADAELILLLAHDHPTVLRYAAEELWRRSDFLQGLLQLADGTESPQLRSEVEKQVLRRASAKPLAAQAVMAAVLKAETDPGLAFALALLPPVADPNSRAFATAKAQLQHNSPQVRVAAVEAVSRLVRTGPRSGSKSVLCEEEKDQAMQAALTPRLQDADPAVRKAALRCLQGLESQAGSRCRAAMGKALLDKDREVRDAAWVMLPTLDVESCASILVSLSSSRLDDFTQKRLLKTLRSLLVPVPRHIKAVSCALSGASWWLRLAVSDMFYAYLGVDDPEVRQSAIAAVNSLAEKTDNKAAGALAALLEDGDASVASATWTAVRPRLTDSNPDVQRVWLEDIRCKSLNPAVRSEVIVAILPKLASTKWLVQVAAARALQVEQPEAAEVRQVVSAFKKDEDSDVQRVAAEVLAALPTGTECSL
ncbi:unnamed protein product [Effrenium voratum]|nr:unnamed protein product [Effrenium voratum]